MSIHVSITCGLSIEIFCFCIFFVPQKSLEMYTFVWVFCCYVFRNNCLRHLFHDFVPACCNGYDVNSRIYSRHLADFQTNNVRAFFAVNWLCFSLLSALVLRSLLVTTGLDGLCSLNFAMQLGKNASVLYSYLA